MSFSNSFHTFIFPFYTFHFILLSWIPLRNYFQLGVGRYMNGTHRTGSHCSRPWRRPVVTWVSWPVSILCVKFSVFCVQFWESRYCFEKRVLTIVKNCKRFDGKESSCKGIVRFSILCVRFSVVCVQFWESRYCFEKHVLTILKNCNVYNCV